MQLAARGQRHQGLARLVDLVRVGVKVRVGVRLRLKLRVRVRVRVRVEDTGVYSGSRL